MAGAGWCSRCALILLTDHACGSFFSSGFSLEVLVLTLITGGVGGRIAEKKSCFFVHTRVSV
ncbi:unnamed protein product [Ectocarpus sp. 13 AM-2016]